MGKRMNRGKAPIRRKLRVKGKHKVEGEGIKKSKPAAVPKPPAKKKVEGEPSLPAVLTPKLDKKMKGENCTGVGGSDKNKSTSSLENILGLSLGDAKATKKMTKAPNKKAKAVKEYKTAISTSTPASTSVDVKVAGKRKVKAGAEIVENPPKRLRGKAKGTMEASRPGPSTNERAKIDESNTTTINAAAIIDDKKRAVNKTPMKGKGKAGKQPKKPSPALKIGAKSVKQKGTTKVAGTSNKHQIKLDDTVNKPLTKAAEMQSSETGGPIVEKAPRKRTMRSPKVGKKLKETTISAIAVKAKSDDGVGANADENEQNASKRLKGEVKGTKEANRAGPSVHVNEMIDESNATINAAESRDDKKRAVAVSKNQTPMALRSNGKAGKQPSKPSTAPKISAKSPKRKGASKVAKKSNTPLALKLGDVNDDAKAKTLNSRSDKKKNPYKVARMRASESESYLDNHRGDYGDIDDYATATTQSLRPPPSSLPIAGSLESWSNSDQEERIRLYENKDVGHNYRKILDDSLMVRDFAKAEKYSLIDHHEIVAKYLKTVRNNEILIQSLTEITMRNNDELREKVMELMTRYKELDVLYNSLNMKLQAQANSVNQESLSVKSYEEKLSTIKSEFNNRLKVLKLKLEKLESKHNWYRSHLKVKNVMSPQKSSGGVGVNKGRKVKKELRNKVEKDGNSSDESLSPGLNCIDVENRDVEINGARKRALVSADAKKLINFPDKLDCPSKMPTTSSDESDDDDESVMTATIAEKKPLKTSAAPVSVRQQIEEMLAAERGNQIKLSLITFEDNDEKEPTPKSAEMPIETGKVNSGSGRDREIEMKKTPSIISSSSSDDESDEFDLDNPQAEDEESESEDDIGTTTEKKKIVIGESETRVLRGKRAFDVTGSSENVSKRIKVASTANTVGTMENWNSMVSSIKSPMQIPQSLLDDLSDTESEIMAVLEKSRSFD